MNSAYFILVCLLVPIFALYPEPSGLFLEETDLNNPSEAVNVPSTESKELFSEEAKSVAAINSDFNASQDVQPNNENSSEENVKSSEESMESLESNLAPEPVAEAPAEEIPTPSKKFGVLFINTTSPFAFKPPEAAFSFNISRGREADNEVGDEQNPASENEPSKKFGVLLINTTNPFVFKPASAGLSFNISSGNGGKGKGREGDNKVNAENSDVDESEPNSAESVGPGNEPSKKFGVLLINTTNPFVFKPASAGLSFNISSGNGGKGKGREAALEEAESEETPAIATASIAADENAEAIEVEDKTIPAEETNSVSKPAPAAPVSAPTEKKFGVLLINNTKPHVFKPVSISINKGRQVILKDRLRGASSDEVCAQMCLDQGKETGRVDGEDCICGCYFYGCVVGPEPDGYEPDLEPPCCTNDICQESCQGGGTCDNKGNCICDCPPCGEYSRVPCPLPEPGYGHKGQKPKPKPTASRP